MPVRKIPKNHLVVTGGFSSQKAEAQLGFESILEKEHMLLLEFDEEVDHFEEQPVRVLVPGVAKGYVPDLLVHFRSGDRQPELVEVKPQELLDRHAHEFAPKFAAADRYCSAKGWIFVKKTEKDIRIPRLSNLKFLRRYRNCRPTEEERSRILGQLPVDGRSSTETILHSLPEVERETWLPIIWHMILSRELLTDLDVDMPVDVPLWLPKLP